MRRCYGSSAPLFYLKLERYGGWEKVRDAGGGTCTPDQTALGFGIGILLFLLNLAVLFLARPLFRKFDLWLRGLATLGVFLFWSHPT